MSSFGKLFKVTTFGESHCKGVGCVIEGVPPRMILNENHVQTQLTRRRPGQSKLTTSRNEFDVCEILCGVEKGVTLGTPIAIFVRNKDQKPQDYKNMVDVPRPSHADFTYQQKYNIRASSGGGRSSARETVGRVAAGAIAEKWLYEKYGIEIVAYVSQVNVHQAPRSLEHLPLSRVDVDAHITRCPHKETSDKMEQEIIKAKAAHDSLGGVITCVVRKVPQGLGEPVFDKLEAKLAHAILSIPATKGFEIGSGFGGVTLNGSKHNDAFVQKGDKLGTKTNNSGGIQGGITNGENIIIRVAFKPIATIGIEQATTNFEMKKTVLAAKGRHDSCMLPRAVPIVESMVALVLADAAMMQESRTAASSMYGYLKKVTPESVDLQLEHLKQENIHQVDKGSRPLAPCHFEENRTRRKLEEKVDIAESK